MAPPAGNHLIGGFVAGVLQSKVDHGVLQSPAHVELKGEVIHPLQDRTEEAIKPTRSGLSLDLQKLWSSSSGKENVAQDLGVRSQGSQEDMCKTNKTDSSGNNPYFWLILSPGCVG